MSKPRTQEVDYFPHYCEHGKVLFILESNFQNDGYAVFYKIEELLAKTNGHCYDCSSTEGWEYLLSKMNVPEDRVISIIAKLVSMNTIDPELWKHKMIWMQSFVDSVEDAYSRRKVSLPVKPSIPSTANPLSGTNDNILPTEREVSGTNDDINPQSKEDKSKEDKTILKDNNSINIELLSPKESGDEKSNGHCPHVEIIKLYHEILPSLQKVKEWTEQRQKILRTRWNEKTERQTLEWWRLYFQYVSESDFLMGKIKPEFQAELEWLVRPKNFVKVIEGKYHRNASTLLSQSSVGIMGWADRERERMKKEGVSCTQEI